MKLFENHDIFFNIFSHLNFQFLSFSEEYQASFLFKFLIISKNLYYPYFSPKIFVSSNNYILNMNNILILFLKFHISLIQEF